MDFKASINDALDYIWKLYAEVNTEFGDAQMFVEVAIQVPCEAAPGEADGHSDVSIYSAIGGILYVIDYKHGAGIAKDVKENKQAKQYAAGLVHGARSPVTAGSVHRVVLVIVQPRAFHPDGDIREFETTPIMLMDYLWEMDAAIEAALQPDAPLNPDEQWCRFCDARSSCRALEKQALGRALINYESVRDIRAPNLPDIKSLDVHRLAYILAAKPMIAMFLKGVEDHVEELIRTGYDVPGNKLVETHARREWFNETDEKDSVLKLAALIGCPVDDLYSLDRKPLTEVEGMIVAAFKQRVGRKQRKNAAEDAKRMFAYFTLKKSSGTTTVVPLDDPRPAVNRALQTHGAIVGLISPPPI